jgi:hypothetical protein
MTVLQAWYDRIPRLVARETLRTLRAIVLGSGGLARRDAERAVRELEQQAGLTPSRPPATDPVDLARRLGIEVIRE